MLKLNWIEFFFRVIPEMLILIWGIYIICKKHINVKIYILSSIIMAIFVFVVRMLPIYFGVHMIINIILTISVMVITGIPIIKAIYSTLLVFFMLSLSEFLNVIILTFFKFDTNLEASNPVMKCVIGIPSLIILVLFIIIIKHLLKMKEGTRNVYN